MGMKMRGYGGKERERGIGMEEADGDAGGIYRMVVR